MTMTLCSFGRFAAEPAREGLPLAQGVRTGPAAETFGAREDDCPTRPRHRKVRGPEGGPDLFFGAWSYGVTSSYHSGIAPFLFGLIHVGLVRKFGPPQFWIASG